MWWWCWIMILTTTVCTVSFIGSYEEMIKMSINDSSLKFYWHPVQAWLIIFKFVLQIAMRVKKVENTSQWLSPRNRESGFFFFILVGISICLFFVLQVSLMHFLNFIFYLPHLIFHWHQNCSPFTENWLMSDL